MLTSGVDSLFLDKRNADCVTRVKASYMSSHVPCDIRIWAGHYSFYFVTRINVSCVMCTDNASCALSHVACDIRDLAGHYSFYYVTRRVMCNASCVYRQCITCIESCHSWRSEFCGTWLFYDVILRLVLWHDSWHSEFCGTWLVTFGILRDMTRFMTSHDYFDYFVTRMHV